jgi:NAD(P)-dependent dehydrogenase (short-subunit alcohol dehydrogenase family)
MSLVDQVVLITGGARGIGAETAKALADKGAKLILTDLDRAALDETAAAIGADRCLAVVADVCDLPSMEAAVAAGVDRFGRLDAAVANAGIASYGSVLHTDPAAFKRVLDINVLGVFHTARAALPALIESKGYFLVVSSLAAFAAAPGLAATSARRCASSATPSPRGTVRVPPLPVRSARSTSPSRSRRPTRGRPRCASSGSS